MKMNTLHLLTILILSGCAPTAGVVQFQPEECQTSNVTILWSTANPNDSSSSNMPSKADFLSGRGDPDQIIVLSENEELWEYKEKLWCGYMPSLYFAFPFVIPVCDGFDRITFKNDTAVRVHFKTIKQNYDALLTIDEIIDKPFCPQ